MSSDEYGLGGPSITHETMLAYLNDTLDDPVTQQWADQVFAAADDARESVGIGRNDELTLPRERARELLSAMWSRLIEESAGHVCEHLDARPLQPTAILWEEHRQVCLDCAREWVVPDTFKKGTKHECPACGRVETLRPDLDPSGVINADLLQRWHYLALVLLCGECSALINEREELPPHIRDGVAELRRQSRNRRSRTG
jgi:predicted RNA-binding Zn-ribbon protein involved in translation (DUF1610 family)